MVYTGDTVMEGLVSQPMVWEAGLLIMEVTYLDGDGRAAAKNFHIHVQARDRPSPPPPPPQYTQKPRYFAVIAAGVPVHL